MYSHRIHSLAEFEESDHDDEPLGRAGIYEYNNKYFKNRAR